jgi:hypothetical protein
VTAARAGVIVMALTAEIISERGLVHTLAALQPKSILPAPWIAA